MPTLLHKGHGLVKGVRFDSWRPVGGVVQAVKVYNLRQVDELVFVDITATLEEREPDYDLVDDIADECFMPLTVGGGVSTVEHAAGLFSVGADKVMLNTVVVEHPDVIGQISATFGSQSVVASIDGLRKGNAHEAYTRSGTTATGLAPAEVARMAEQHGAGEIVVTSIDRDGTMSGYDLELIADVATAVSVPVVASGGAGSYAHMKAAFEAGASAVAAASMFHFTQQTPIEAKRYLGEHGLPIRR